MYMPYNGDKNSDYEYDDPNFYPCKVCKEPFHKTLGVKVTLESDPYTNDPLLMCSKKIEFYCCRNCLKNLITYKPEKEPKGNISKWYSKEWR